MVMLRTVLTAMVACVVTQMLVQTLPAQDRPWGRSGGDPVAAVSGIRQDYSSPEAVQTADRMILYQRDMGGWYKSADYSRSMSAEAADVVRAKKTRTDCTLDNGATYTEIRYLARVHQATGLERFSAAALKGIDWILAAQYPSGGWPQFYPNVLDYNPSNSSHNPRGLSAFITYNDNAMLGAMEVLEDIRDNKPEFAFVDDAYRTRAAAALKKAVDCILRTQIVVNGKRTAWCAQYDEQTLEPRWGRTFEPVSICGSESVGLVLYLMRIPNPSPQIIEAVQSAIAWFNSVKITGYRYDRVPDDMNPHGSIRVLQPDPAAPPLWARFYEIGTNRPVFSDRLSPLADVVAYDVTKLTAERQSGYRWYANWPEAVMEAYPAWQQRWAPDRNVLH